jgi:hypothetical protein
MRKRFVQRASWRLGFISAKLSPASGTCMLPLPRRDIGVLLKEDQKGNQPIRRQSGSLPQQNIDELTASLPRSEDRTRSPTAISRKWESFAMRPEISGNFTPPLVKSQG